MKGQCQINGVAHAQIVSAVNFLKAEVHDIWEIQGECDCEDLGFEIEVICNLHQAMRVLNLVLEGGEVT